MKSAPLFEAFFNIFLVLSITICNAIATLISAVNSHIRASNSAEHLQDSLSTFVRAKPREYDQVRSPVTLKSEL